MFAEVGAYDAKTKLPELLRQVQKGMRFTITHRGKPIADLVPSGAARTRDVTKAIQAMADFQRVKGVKSDQVTAWIAEGRR